MRRSPRNHQNNSPILRRDPIHNNRDIGPTEEMTENSTDNEGEETRRSFEESNNTSYSTNTSSWSNNDSRGAVSFDSSDNAKHASLSSKNLNSGHTKILENIATSCPKQSSFSETYNLTILISVIIVVVAVFITIYFIFPNAKTSMESQKSGCKFEDIKSKLPVQNKYFWKSLEVGVNSVVNSDPTKPTTFFFLYNDTALINNMLGVVVDRIRLCLQSEYEPIFIHSSELKTERIMNDSGHLIVEYRDKLANSQVMTIEDVQTLPGQIAKVFHFFCDDESPLVERAVIIFTLNISKNKHQIPQNNNPSDAVHVAQKILHSLWANSLLSHILEPLITRMTDTVLYLSAEG